MAMKEYKIKGYVARDKNPALGSDLFLYSTKPEWDDVVEMWIANRDFVSGLPQEMYPNLKYTDQPIEVELVIRPKHEETAKTPKG